MLNNFFEKARNKHEYIFKVLFFVIAISLVVLLLPREGKFKYEFQENKPWLHDDLLAPFDFAINKTKQELVQEKEKIKEEHTPFFNLSKLTIDEVNESYKEWLNTNFKDSLNVEKKEEYLRL